MKTLQDELIAMHTASMLDDYKQACERFSSYKSYTYLESTNYLIYTRYETPIDNEQNSLDAIIEQLQALKSQLADKKISYFCLGSETDRYDETTYYACYTVIELQNLDSAMLDIAGKSKYFAGKDLGIIENRKGTKRHDDIMNCLNEFRARNA